MIKIVSKLNIANLVRPELPSGSAMTFKPPDLEVTMGNTSGVGYRVFSNDDRMLLEEEEWNELFGNSREFIKV